MAIVDRVRNSMFYALENQSNISIIQSVSNCLAYITVGHIVSCEVLHNNNITAIWSRLNVQFHVFKSMVLQNLFLPKGATKSDNRR